MRTIFYVTGTRADFGLMASTLQQIAAHPQLQLQVAVTGMHLSPSYGLTVRDIEALGLPIVARIPTNVEDRTPAAMAQGIGEAVIGLTEALAQARPDLVMVIGDRGEMLAGAIAALHLGIPIVHLHGGERSGTVDEPVRHAITKLSHWHFVATEESRERVDSPGRAARACLDHRRAQPGRPGAAGREAEGAGAGRAGPGRDRAVRAGAFPSRRPGNGRRLSANRWRWPQALRDTLDGSPTQVLWLSPNADAGSAAILRALGEADDERLHRITHLPRPLYVAALRHAEALVGNSSSGNHRSGLVRHACGQHRQPPARPRAQSQHHRLRRRASRRSRPRSRRRWPMAVIRRPIAMAMAVSGARITHLLATLPIECRAARQGQYLLSVHDRRTISAIAGAAFPALGAGCRTHGRGGAGRAARGG